MPQKKRVHLTKGQRAAMKEDVRIAVEYPYKTHARAEAVREIAERYNVSRSVVWTMCRSTRPAPSDPAVASPAAVSPLPPVAPPVDSARYTLMVGGVAITAPSKTSLLDVVERLVREST